MPFQEPKKNASKKWFNHHALSASGNRHLAKFVPWHLSSEEELHRWGVVLTAYSWRLQRNNAPRPVAGSPTPRKLKPSGEEGVQQMEALLGLRALTTNVNLPNKGQMPGFPANCVVETYAEFGQDSLRPILASQLPSGAAHLVRNTVNEQELILQAGFEGSAEIAFQALISHPLVHLSADKAWNMFREMLDPVRHMLHPGFSKS